MCEFACTGRPKLPRRLDLAAPILICTIATLTDDHHGRALQPRTAGLRSESVPCGRGAASNASALILSLAAEEPTLHKATQRKQASSGTRRPSSRGPYAAQRAKEPRTQKEMREIRPGRNDTQRTTTGLRPRRPSIAIQLKHWRRRALDSSAAMGSATTLSCALRSESTCSQTTSVSDVPGTTCGSTLELGSPRNPELRMSGAVARFLATVETTGSALMPKGALRPTERAKLGQRPCCNPTWIEGFGDVLEAEGSIEAKGGPNAAVPMA